MNKLFLEDVWNDILTAIKRDRPLTSREHIWATEIGKNHYDRYLKMNGIIPDVQIEPRVLRKFAAGDIFEELIGDYLSRIGLIQSSQERIELPADDNHLKVSGKIDYIAGIVNWDEAINTIGKLSPEDNERERTTKKILHRLVEQFKIKYPNGLKDVIFEIKTINSLVFWAKKDYLKEAYPHHVMQIYTYLKAKNLPEGRIVYLSKDDLTIKEMTIYHPDPVLETKWEEDVCQMTDYIKSQKEPPKPPAIIFDPHSFVSFQKNKQKYKIEGAWKENWEIKFSPYFKRITEFDIEEEWFGSLKKEIKEKNDKLKEEYIKNNNL